MHEIHSFPYHESEHCPLELPVYSWPEDSDGRRRTKKEREDREREKERERIERERERRDSVEFTVFVFRFVPSIRKTARNGRRRNKKKKG